MSVVNQVITFGLLVAGSFVFLCPKRETNKELSVAKSERLDDRDLRAGAFLAAEPLRCAKHQLVFSNVRSFLRWGLFQRVPSHRFIAASYQSLSYKRRHINCSIVLRECMKI